MRVPRLTVSELLPGDILLHRSLDQKPHQKLIARITGSPYTHASIAIGNGEIVESVVPRVRIALAAQSVDKNTVVAVLRSQMGFGPERQQQLRDFAEELVRQGTSYDISGAFTYRGNNQEYVTAQLEIIRQNFGTVRSSDEFARRSYFCSALVVACYCVVGIIGDTAQVAYPPDVHSPADLSRDPTFGWLFGYLAREGVSVPDNDPLLEMTTWNDIPQHARWWL